MGQYYIPLLIAEDGEVTTLYAHDFDDGLKLMEHSWIGFALVNAVLSLIHNQKKKVAWIGDYSKGWYECGYSKAMPEDFLEYYKMAWDRSVREKYRKTFISFTSEDLNLLTTKTKDKGFLVNHDKQQFLDMNEYYEQSADISFLGWCINPLPLLTACGNGEGGGDYRENCPNFDMCGMWAFDTLEYTENEPDKYE